MILRHIELIVAELLLLVIGYSLIHDVVSVFTCVFVGMLIYFTYPILLLLVFFVYKWFFNASISQTDGMLERYCFVSRSMKYLLYNPLITNPGEKELIVGRWWLVGLLITIVFGIPALIDDAPRFAYVPWGTYWFILGVVLPFRSRVILTPIAVMKKLKGGGRGD